MHSRIIENHVDTQVTTTTLPRKIVAAIDKANKRTLESRSAWLRRAAFDLATREGIVRRPARDEAAALDVDEVI